VPTSPHDKPVAVADGAAVTAAILAGGLARRMGGADKALLDVGGSRIVERQVAALRQVAGDIVIVGGDASRFAKLDVRTAADVIPGCGALGGIYSALAASTHPRTLVVACDLPFLSVPLLRRLVQPFRSADVDVVMPRTSDGLQPLCAVYAAACAGAVRRRIDRGALKAAGLVEDVRVEEIGPGELAMYDPDGLMFVNVNTPHDYERAKDLVVRVPGSRAVIGDPITDATA
jgi:molybdopterin-guanine dinucleotide biosynthesis protein A